MTTKKTPSGTRALPKLPKQILILGIEFKVEEDSSMPEDEYGETSIEKRQIRINPKYKELYLDTFWHEVFHAALGVSGQSFLYDEKQEEALVRMFEHALSPYLKLPEG